MIFHMRINCVFTGRSVHTYFKIRRPKNVRLSFEGIVNRTNSPFVLTLCLPEPLNHHSAEVIKSIHVINIHFFPGNLQSTNRIQNFWSNYYIIPRNQ